MTLIQALFFCANASAADLGDAIVFPDLNRSIWMNPAALAVGASKGGKGGSGSLDAEMMFYQSQIRFRASYARGFSGFGFGLGLRKDPETFSLLGGLAAGVGPFALGLAPNYTTGGQGFGLGSGVQLDLGTVQLAVTTASVTSPLSRWVFGFGLASPKWTFEIDLRFQAL
ncbi:MAG: hypothetical protein AAB425_09710, partial [Bdellovibrionota bacterium]